MATNPKEQNCQRTNTRAMVVINKHPEANQQKESSVENNYSQLKTFRGLVNKYEQAALSQHDSNKKIKKQPPNAKKDQEVPKLKPKPRPVTKGQAPQMKVQISGESEYAQLVSIASAETENNYESLCHATRERAQKSYVDTSNTVMVSFNQADEGVQLKKEVCDLSDYENHQFKAAFEDLQRNDSNRNCCCVYWKVILGIGTVALAAVVIVVILLVIGALGLFHTSDNTESYMELQRSAQQMAEQIVTLERQLNSSVVSLQQQLDHSKAVSEDTLSLLAQLQSNIMDFKTSVRDQLQTTSSDIVTLNNEVRQVDMALMKTIHDTNRLNISTQRLNSSLRTLAVPIGCDSRVYTMVTVNETGANSTMIHVDQKNMHIECEAAIYPASSLPTTLTLEATLRELDSGRVQCECQWLDHDDYNNTSLACSMIVTTCTDSWGQTKMIKQ